MKQRTGSFEKKFKVTINRIKVKDKKKKKDEFVVNENDAVIHFKKVCKELGIVMPVSFYERDINTLYNSCALIDADGEVLGVYRKTHIPDDHYYQEKFYFTPGDTGFCTAVPPAG